MSSGNKVYKYRCNICQRNVEQVSDNRRPSLLRCIITDLCRGTLEPVGSRRGDRAKLTTPQADLADRVSRGSSLSITPALEDPVLIGLSTFSNTNGLSISGPKRSVEGSESVYTVKDINGHDFELERRAAAALYPSNSRIDLLIYELTAAVLQSLKYTFTFNSIAQVIEGIDNSKEQRLLRFSATDNLVVLVNGVELQTSDYDSSEADTIRLTPGISATEITIEVYVFKDRSQLIDENKLVRLSCIPLSETNSNEALLRSNCAWGDTARLIIEPDGIDRSLLFCTDLSKLEQRKTYSIARFEAVSSTNVVKIIDPSEVWLLLSDAPHSFVDKRLDEVINGSALVEQFSFTYDLSEATGSQIPVASASVLTMLSIRLAPESEANIPPSSTSGAQRPYVKRSEAYIIGPA